MFKLTHHTTKSVMNDYVDIKGTGTKTAQGFFKQKNKHVLPSLSNPASRNGGSRATSIMEYKASETLDPIRDPKIDKFYRSKFVPQRISPRSSKCSDYTQNGRKNEVLHKIHDLRMQMFNERTNVSAVNEKPYLPMLSSDEKEIIMEQYYESKKKLNKK